ncbi:uncharacterized protein UHOD_01866 [Ustilago sp. UG-2017b]|nr:uncharacterized protein UHOD_01866 [Ustilago sp. UG-2017b]
MARNPQRLINTVFWNTKVAKPITKQGLTGAKSLFFTYSVRPKFLQNRPEGGYLGAWHVGSADQEGCKSLFLHGFYPSDVQDFDAVAQHPRTNTERYRVWRNRRKHWNRESSFRLKFERIETQYGESERESPSQVLSGAERTPEIDTLLSTGQLASVLSGRQYIAGLHLYAYQVSPDIIDFLQKWKPVVGQRPNTLSLIPLTKDQIDNLSVNMSPTLRRRRLVKIIRHPDGERLMLQHNLSHTRMYQHTRPVLTVWKLGPFIQGRRLLIAKGFYDMTGEEWNRMTPRTIPGLLYSFFSYSTFTVR